MKILVCEITSDTSSFHQPQFFHYKAAVFWVDQNRIEWLILMRFARLAIHVVG